MGQENLKIAIRNGNPQTTFQHLSVNENWLPDVSNVKSHKSSKRIYKKKKSQFSTFLSFDQVFIKFHQFLSSIYFNLNNFN